MSTTPKTENQDEPRPVLIDSNVLLDKLLKASCDAYDDYTETDSFKSLGAHQAFSTTRQWVESEVRRKVVMLPDIAGDGQRQAHARQAMYDES